MVRTGWDCTIGCLVWISWLAVSLISSPLHASWILVLMIKDADVVGHKLSPKYRYPPPSSTHTHTHAKHKGMKYCFKSFFNKNALVFSCNLKNASVFYIFTTNPLTSCQTWEQKPPSFPPSKFIYIFYYFTPFI